MLSDSSRNKQIKNDLPVLTDSCQGRFAVINLRVIKKNVWTKAADEEALPFKLAYTLCHQGLRLWISPESTHSSWNDVRNALRRSSLQHTLLLATTMNNVLHGPFKSGRNRLTLAESAAHMEHMDSSRWDELLEAMANDLKVDIDDDALPKQPSEIATLKCVTNLPSFVSRTKPVLFF